MSTGSLWLLMALRVGVLAGERVAFHGLGRGRRALPTALIAYGGAGAWLWIACLVMHHVEWVNGAILPGVVYALSFFCYTKALAQGPVGLVSAFANASVVMMFFIFPRWNAGSLFAMVFFIGGAWLILWGEFRASSAVLWMLCSDGALVAGRMLDLKGLPAVSLPYAATLFTVVALWLAIPALVGGEWPRARQLLGERPGWSFFASGCNGLSYLTVLELLRYVSPTLVEVVSAWAGVAATLAGVAVFGEAGAKRKVAAATLMTLATVMLISSQGGKMQ